MKKRRVEKMVRQYHGAAMKGFRLVLFFDASMPPRNGSEGDGDELNSQKEGRRGRQVRKEKNGDEWRDAQHRSRSPRGDLSP